MYQEGGGMVKKQDSGQGKEYKLSSKVIKDEFYCDGKKIVVLDNKAFKNIPKDELILAGLVNYEVGLALEALTDQEYKNAAKKYCELLKLINGEDEDNNE